MRFLWLPTQNPLHNLAVEAYLLQHSDVEIFMLFISQFILLNRIVLQLPKPLCVLKMMSLAK